MTASPFAQAHAQLSPLGFTLLPALPHNLDRPGAGKAPGHFAGGGWSGLPRWSQYAQTGVSSFLQGMWERMPNANAGFLTGTPAGRDAEGRPLQLVVLDFDCQDSGDLALLLACAPPSPAEKVGRVGVSRLFRASADLKSRPYDSAKGGGRLLDLLCAGRFCVSPPSIHPKSGLEYRWTQGPVPVSELPILTSEDLEQLEEALQMVGWEPQAEMARVSPGPRVERVRGDYDNEWAETNGEALARLSEWFPLLNLPGARQSRAGVFSAVPVWRPSGSARPTELRKPNLSASSGMGAVPAGIRDWGASGSDANLTAIDLVQRALDLDAPDAMRWLRQTLGLDDDTGPAIDLSAMLAARDEADLPAPLRGLGDALETKAAPVSVVTEAEAVPGVLGGAGSECALSKASTTHGVETELPAHLCKVPGLVGNIAEWITATARKPQPSLSLAMAIGLVGTVAGRKFCGPTQSATHLFMLCTGPTGSGKNAPKKAAQQLLAAAGLNGYIGPSSFQSASALIQHVAQRPASLCVMDEFSNLIGKLNAKNNSTHERAISTEMRQFWTLSFETYEPPRWAASRDRMQPEPIISPALSLIGLTTADELYTVLQGADVLSGFLNRFTLVATLNNPQDVEPSASVFDPPPALVEGLQAIANVGGAMAQATMHNLRPDRPLVSVPWDDGIGGFAHRTFKALVATLAEMNEHEALTQRCAEMAVRLATIRAIGIGGEHARVTVEDMQWGADFALWSTRRLIADVEANMSESEWQAKAKFVLRCVTDAAGRRITRGALCKKVNHRFPARDLDAIIKGLIETGEVVEISSRTPGNSSRTSRPGPAAVTYFAP